MRIRKIKIGSRDFLDIGGDYIPIDDILHIKTKNVKNGGCDNNVQIIVEGHDEYDFIWTYDDADVIREFLLTCQF